MPGRPRKATAILEANGSFDKHPERRRARANEPPPNGPIGDPPLCFTDAQKELWVEIVALCPPGVLAKSDRLIVEMISRLLEKLRNGKISRGELAILTSACTRVGLTPADRSRVAVPTRLGEDGEEDPLTSFFISKQRIH